MPGSWVRVFKSSRCIEHSLKRTAIRYRLAPEYIFPCAVIDAVTAYLHILKEYDPASVHLIGDSAGGGLVLATLLAIRDGGWPQPTGAIALSPWLDLTHSLPSFQTNIDTDFLPRNPYGNVEEDAQVHLYASDAELKNP